MKKLLAILVLTITTTAMANTTVIVSKVFPKNQKWELFRTQYKLNTDLGRAWILVELTDMTPFDDIDYQDLNVKIPGMSYNKVSGDVVVNGVVCATTKKTRRSIKIYPTGNCKIGSNVQKIQVDDGFYVKTKNQLNVTLTTY